MATRERDRVSLARRTTEDLRDMLADLERQAEAVEAELERREYDESDPASPANQASDARDECAICGGPNH